MTTHVRGLAPPEQTGSVRLPPDGRHLAWSGWNPAFDVEVGADGGRTPPEQLDGIRHPRDATFICMSPGTPRVSALTTATPMAVDLASLP